MLLALLLPTLIRAVTAEGRAGRDLSSDDFARGRDIRPYPLPWWHPEIQRVAENEVRARKRLCSGNPCFNAWLASHLKILYHTIICPSKIPGPSNHPLLDDDPEFQRFIRANTGEDHRFLDSGYPPVRYSDDLLVLVLFVE